MQIAKIEIKNYRSIKEMIIDCQSMMILLGPNNHGKSNVLSALDYALSTSDKGSIEDFFTDKNGTTKELWVELTFNNLTDDEETTFKKYVMNNEMRVRKTSLLEEDNVTFSYNGYISEPDEEWLKSNHAKEYAKREKINNTPLTDFIQDNGRLKIEDVVTAQEEYIKNNFDSLNFSTILEVTPFLGTKNVAGGVLPDFYLIPAVRDLTDEIKIKNTTNFGRIMSRVIADMMKNNENFKEAQESLNEAICSLNNRNTENGAENEIQNLEENLKKYLFDWDDININITVDTPKIEKIFELGTNLEIDDGVSTDAKRKGQGLQRALIFALLRYWAEMLLADKVTPNESGSSRKKSSSLVFAIEEPELFLHPHGQRSLFKSLEVMSEVENYQVFLCTHSTHFIDLEKYKRIALISKNNPADGSKIRQCTHDIFSEDDKDEKSFKMAQWVNPDRGEMFFARKVVFVEGATEKAVLPYIADIFNCFKSDVSIIDCGGKGNLLLYIKIAKAFSIPFLIMHDEDKGKLEQENLNQKISQSVDDEERVIVCSDDFEDMIGMQKGGDNKPMKALEHLKTFTLEHLKVFKAGDTKEVIDIIRKIYE